MLTEELAREYMRDEMQVFGEELSCWQLNNWAWRFAIRDSDDEFVVTVNLGSTTYWITE